jgi:hypothetical protein
MDKKHRILLIIISIIVWATIGGLGRYFINSFTYKPKKVKGVAEYDTLIQPTHYKTIASQAFKNVVLETDLGPVQIYFEPSEKHSVKFHQSYLKYVDINYKGDTLVIHAKKTTKSTKEKPVFKQIYVYAPDIKYYRGEASQTTFSYFSIEQLKVDSRSSWVRFYGTSIKNLELNTEHPCNYRLEDNSYFVNVKADINDNSAMTCLSYIHNDLVIKTKNFKEIDLSNENVKKLIIEK